MKVNPVVKASFFAPTVYLGWPMLKGVVLATFAGRPWPMHDLAIFAAGVGLVAALIGLVLTHEKGAS